MKIEELLAGYFICFMVGFVITVFFCLLLLPLAYFLRLVAAQYTKVMPRRLARRTEQRILSQGYRRSDFRRICFVFFLLFGFLPLAGKMTINKVFTSNIEAIATRVSPDGRYVASFLYADLGGIGGSSYVQIKPTSFWYKWSAGDVVVYDTGGRILKGISWSGRHTLQVATDAPETQLVSHDLTWKDVKLVYQQHSL